MTVFTLILTLIGFQCPHFGECAEIQFKGTPIATCYGDTLAPYTSMPCDSVFLVELTEK